jgi:hypothetical protein
VSRRISPITGLLHGDSPESRKPTRRTEASPSVDGLVMGGWLTNDQIIDETARARAWAAPEGPQPEQKSYDHWETGMTDARPFTVVCVADDSRTTERVDLVENTIVAFVMVENVPDAMAAGQAQAAESGG